MSSPLFTHNCSICANPYESREQFPAHSVCPACMGFSKSPDLTGSPARQAAGADDREKRRKDKRKEKQAKKSRKKNRKK